MKWLIGLFLILGVIFVGWLVANSGNKATTSPLTSSGNEGGLMQLTSTAFTQGQSIPAKYTCQGANHSPPLTVSGVPGNAKSLAIIVEDIDAPSGSFIHWVGWNIPVSQAQIGEGALPSGSEQGTNDFGQIGYGGPCPPNGEHHYYFKLLALDSQLDLPPSTTADNLLKAVEGKIIDQVQLIGLYSQN